MGCGGRGGSHAAQTECVMLCRGRRTPASPTSLLSSPSGKAPSCLPAQTCTKMPLAAASNSGPYPVAGRRCGSSSSLRSSDSRRKSSSQGTAVLLLLLLLLSLPVLPLAACPSALLAAAAAKAPRSSRLCSCRQPSATCSAVRGANRTSSGGHQQAAGHNQQQPEGCSRHCSQPNGAHPPWASGHPCGRW